MSRTPKKEIHKLPLWVQELLRQRDYEIEQLLLSEEHLHDVIKQLEDVNEELAKRGEDNARAAFETTVVDL